MLNLQTIVISLVRSPQRREKVREELSKTNLRWLFLDAVDGSLLKPLPPEYQARKVKRLQGFELTPNEIGCFLSHKQTWQACMAANKPTLVFEDDFILEPSFEAVLTFVLKEFQDWQVMRLQGLAESSHVVVQSAGEFSVVRNLADPVGATAYIVKPEAARILIDHAKDIYEPLDHYLEHKSKHGVEVLAVKPYPVDITKAPSTISDRPDIRKPMKGWKKKLRSVNRTLDRMFSPNPWFPKW